MTQFLNRNYPVPKGGQFRSPKADPDNTFGRDIGDPSDSAAFVDFVNANLPPNANLAPGTVLTPDSPYLADYCTAILWNPERLTVGPINCSTGGPINRSTPRFTKFNPRNVDRPYEIYYGFGDVGFVQQFHEPKTGIEVNIVAAHLKSGEGEKEEQERVRTLSELLGSVVGLPNPICLIDTNSSSNYRRGIPLNVSTVIADKGFWNVVPQDSVPADSVPAEPPLNRFQCLKMRGADGNQPAKFMEFMFDTIDGILVRRRPQGPLQGGAQIISIPGYSPQEILYPIELAPVLRLIRTDPKIRQLVSNWGLNCNNRYNDTDEAFVRSDGEIRPTGDGVTEIKDKKGVVLKMMSANRDSRWGEDTNRNQYQGMARYIASNTDLGFEITDAQLETVFGSLYPNRSMPSDHPPIAAEVEIIRTDD